MKLAILIILALLAVVLLLLVRRRSFPAQDIGRIEDASSNERESWREYYDALAGDDPDGEH